MVCGRCGQLKLKTMFSTAGQGRIRKTCKTCRNQLQELRRHKMRDYVISYLKSHPCVDCGESDIVVLHFDHFRDKVTEVWKMAYRVIKLERLQAEMAKCEVRCANCHMRKTARDEGWFKLTA